MQKILERCFLKKNLLPIVAYIKYETTGIAGNKMDEKNTGKLQQGADNQTYLYHKQDRNVKRRRAPDYKPSGGARKGPAHNNMAQDTLLANIRMFALVFLIMLVFLVVAVFVVKKGVQLKKRVVAKEKNPVVAEEVDDPVTDANEVAGTPPTGWTVDEMPELDTVVMRKAVFLGSRADKLADSGDYEGAVDLYAEALEVWPHLMDVWGRMGQAYLAMQRYERAEMALRKAVQQDPSNPELLNQLGLALMYQGAIEDADDLFATAIEIDHSYAESYYNRALCCISRKQAADAEMYLLQYIRLIPDDARALKELAYLRASEGDYAQALDYLQQAIAEKPDWPALYFDAAAACALLGQVENTFQYLDEVLPLSSPQAVYQIYLQPAFNDLRLTESGAELEKKLAELARMELESSESATNSSAADDELTRQPDGSPAEAVGNE